jgi:hypothetical protein
MPNRFASVLIASILGSASVAAQAQPASPPAAKTEPSTTVSPLTVHAAPEPTVIEKQTQAFVRGFPPERNGEHYHLHDRDRFKKITRPIQAWYVTAASPWAGPEVLDDPDSYSPIGCDDDPRTLKCGIQTVFKNVLVVADAKALQGQAGLLSDYLVVLTLSQPRSLDGCNNLASVIDVLAPTACSGRDLPDGLTASDAAYLTALYEAYPYNNKTFEQSDIARRMARILVSANPTLTAR